jgi:hypothetical protein
MYIAIAKTNAAVLSPVFHLAQQKYAPQKERCGMENALTQRTAVKEDCTLVPTVYFSDDRNNSDAHEPVKQRLSMYMSVPNSA